MVKGILVENKDDVPPTIALGFKVKKNNGKYRFIGDEDIEGIDKTIIKGWFSAIPNELLQ